MWVDVRSAAGPHHQICEFALTWNLLKLSYPLDLMHDFVHEN
jgi:hypothetical protein